MPSTRSPSSTESGLSPCDAYLHVQTKRAGKVKGEATASGFTDDIVVLGWSWGQDASSAVAAAQERRSYQPLRVRKHVDRATTGLMSALATNDEVKEARLQMRRPGGAQEVYLKIVLEQARVIGVHHDTDDGGHPFETLSIVFQKVTVEYTPQQTTGQRGGSTTFNDEFLLT